MFGTLVNVAAIIGGTLIGLLFRRGIPEHAKQTIFHAIGLVVILIGLKMGMQASNELILILSLILGGVIGEALRIDDHLNRFGERLYTWSGSGESTFIEGFVTASLIYSIGAMATLGPLEAGLNGNYQILYVKSSLDGVTSVLLGSSFGIGVAFSVIPVLLWQGTITLFAHALEPVLSDVVVTYLSATGGLLIAAIGINVLLDRDIKVANLLPAIVVSVLATLIALSRAPGLI